MNHPEWEIIERKIRRAAAVNALRKSEKIVARENQADMEKVKAVPWFVRYGWMILLFGALLLVYGVGII